MLETLLSQEGFEQIRTASTAADALATAQDFVPQVVLLDVMLPDGDGFELFSQLRRQADIPVLFLSARDEDEARLRGLGLGADDYITKPFLPQELWLRLCAVLRRTLCGGRAFSAGADPPWLRDGGYGQRHRDGEWRRKDADRKRIRAAGKAERKPGPHRHGGQLVYGGVE